MWTKEQIPILRILLPFMIGIASIKEIPLLSDYYLYFGILGLACIVVSEIRKRDAGIFIWLSFFFLGMAIMGKADDSGKIEHVNTDKSQRLAIIQDKTDKGEKGLQMDLLLLPENLKVKANSNITEDSGYEIGDSIIFEAGLNKPMSASTPWSFDYKDYLNRQNTYYTCYIHENALIEHKPFTGFSLARTGYDLKKKAILTLGNVLPKAANVDLIKSITFGDKSSLDQELKDRMQTAGLMHIMAVSGLHIGIIYLFLTWITIFLKRMPILRRSIIIPGIWLFIIICGLPASAVRAGLMLSIYEIGKQFSRSPYKFNVLAISAFVILLFDPFQLFQIGFQFSFIAIVGIFFFYDRIEAALLNYTKMPKSLCSSISMSFAAQAILTPLCLYYFGYVSYWFWLWTFLAIPATTAIMIGSMTSIAAWYILPVSISSLIAFVPHFSGMFLEFIGYLQTLIPVNGLILHIPWYFMLGFLLLFIVYIAHSFFDLRLRKYLLMGSFVWLFAFSAHRTIIKQQSAVYIFSTYADNHILIKNANTGLIIGDPLTANARLNLEAYFGIDKWDYRALDLFDENLDILLKDNENTEKIATLVADKEILAEIKSAIYTAKPWDNSFASSDNATNISVNSFIYKK